MRVLVTMTLMIAFVAMTVTAADAGIAKASCGSQLRAQDMCYGVATSASDANPVKKPSSCLELILIGDQAGIERGRGVVQWFAAARPAASIGEADFWRPPRL